MSPIARAFNQAYVQYVIGIPTALHDSKELNRLEIHRDNPTWTTSMDKLWRILYSPRRVYDELMEDVQIRLPLVTILAAIAIFAIAIAFLAPHPRPSGEEILNFHKQLVLLEREPDRENWEKRRQELIEETYGPQDIVLGTRISANPWAPVTWPIGFLVVAMWMGTCFFFVFRGTETQLSWRQWFGFCVWSELPIVFSSALDVVFAARGMNRPLLFEIYVQDLHFFIIITAIFSMWTLVLQTQGLRSWTSKGIGFCIGRVLLTNLMAVVPITLVLFAFLSLISGGA